MRPLLPPQPPQNDHALQLSPQAARLLAVIEADWRTISRAHPVPRHADIDPVALHQALPHAFVAARTATGSLRIRVAGQVLHDMLGFDPRGMSVGCFFTDSAAAQAVAVLEDCLSTPAILTVPLTGPRRMGRRAVHGALLALPLADTMGQVTKLMGAIVLNEDRARRGLRWEVSHSPALRRAVLGPGWTDAAGGDPPRTGLRMVVDNTRI